MRRWAVQAFCLPAELCPAIQMSYWTSKPGLEGGSVSLCWNVGDEDHRKWWQVLCYISSPGLLIGASTGPWYLIRRSSVCHSLSWGRDLLSELRSQAQEDATHALSLNSHWHVCLFHERRKAKVWRALLALFPEGVGIFPCLFGRNLSWLPPKARVTCFLSASISWFLLDLCCVYNCSDKGVSQEERGLFPQAGNLAAP